MEDSNKKGKYTRRDFIETGLTGAVGVALGLAAGQLLPSDQGKAPEMVKLLTADGKLVEVEKRLLPPMCGKPAAVSNTALKAWMDNEKS